MTPPPKTITSDSGYALQLQQLRFTPIAPDWTVAHAHANRGAPSVLPSTRPSREFLISILRRASLLLLEPDDDESAHATGEGATQLFAHTSTTASRRKKVNQERQSEEEQERQ